MSKIKTERIGSQIVKELSEIILEKAKSEILNKITITAADVTSDLGLAKIYYTYLSEYDKKEVQDELDKASSFLRTELAERMDIRHTPNLRFIFDESIEYGANIEKILADINK
ncbi:MAG: 30S ribosome-binding factor RbfA [Bacilli bacterium]|nr:30S ribosome-binding factor RbfA [Bacilli bacterium]MDD4795209.1 30S ribosome-binding factor RbfA [Bacilli bacterium]